MEKVVQVSVRVQTILNGGLDQAEHNSASFCSFGRIGKQEVLPVNDKGLDTSLCPVIAQFQSAVFEIIGQIWPLLFQISKRLAQGRLGRRCSGICPCKHGV